MFGSLQRGVALGICMFLWLCGQSFAMQWNPLALAPEIHGGVACLKDEHILSLDTQGLWREQKLNDLNSLKTTGGQLPAQAYLGCYQNGDQRYAWTANQLLRQQPDPEIDASWKVSLFDLNVQQMFNVEGQNILLARGPEGQWKIGPWNDDLTLWQQQADTIWAEDDGTWAIQAASPLEVVFAKASSETAPPLRRTSTRSHLEGLWKTQDLTWPADTAVRHLQQTQGLSLRILEQNQQWRVELSKDGGLTWHRRELPDLGNTSFKALNYQWRNDGQLDIIGDLGQWLNIQPHEIFSWDFLSLQEAVTSLELTWERFPWATQYRILRDGSIIDNSTNTEQRHLLAGQAALGSRYRVEGFWNEQWISGPEQKFERGPSITWNMLHRASSNASEYQMISIPHGAVVMDDDRSYRPLDYLEAFLGPEHHPANWRFGHWSPERLTYQMGVDIPDMLPQKSYWMLSAWNIEYDILGYEPAGNVASIALKPGWNMVSTPFNHSTSLQELSVLQNARTLNLQQILEQATPSIAPAIWTFQQGAYLQEDILTPQRGAWMKNNSQAELYVLIPSLKTQESHLQKQTWNMAGHELSEALQRKKVRLASQEQPPSPPSSLSSASSLARSASGGGGGGCLLR